MEGQDLEGQVAPNRSPEDTEGLRLVQEAIEAAAREQRTMMAAIEAREVELLAEAEQEIARWMNQARRDGNELLRTATNEARRLLEAATAEADRLIRVAGRLAPPGTAPSGSDAPLASDDGLHGNPQKLSG